MIYFISDIHGEFDFKGLKKYLDIATPNDLLIILGDVGLNFDATKENREFTEKFLKIKRKVAFIEGNHENFEFLDSFPIEEWQGGVVNRLTENIVRLRRGNVYNIGGYKFFTFGGCKSSPKWKQMGLWYDGEEPTKSECDFAIKRLENIGNKVDFILTHKYELEESGNTGCELLFSLCKYLDENIAYKKWLSGHWHTIDKHDEKHLYIYNELLPIDVL